MAFVLPRQCRESDNWPCLVHFSPMLCYRMNGKMCVKTAIKTDRTPTRLRTTRVRHHTDSRRSSIEHDLTIRRGEFPSWTLKVQVMPFAEAESYRFSRTLIGAWAIE
jgi:catalase